MNEWVNMKVMSPGLQQLGVLILSLMLIFDWCQVRKQQLELDMDQQTGFK